MRNLKRNLSIVIMIIFTMAITGCLSDGDTKKEVEDTKVEQPKEDDGTVTDDEGDAEKETLPAYDPDGNKSPKITYFGTDDLDEAILESGKTITLKSEALDPEGADTTVEYTATGGTIDGNEWTAPEAGGLYQIKAVANDGFADSDPEVLEIKVPGKEGGIQVASLSATKRTNAPANGPKRAITSAETLNASKVLIETGESVELDLKYSTGGANTAVAPEFSVADNTGNLVVKDWDDSGSATLTHTYTYTAASTAPSGNSVTITFNIMDVADPTDYATASITFIVNTPPSISNVEFSTEGSESYIEPGANKTIEVTASDADDGDTLTYAYETYDDGTGTDSGTLAEATNSIGEVDYTAGSSSGTEKVLVIVTDQRGSETQEVFSITNASPMYLALADSGDDYDTVTDADGNVLADYDITLDTTNEVSMPIQLNEAGTTIAATLGDTFTAYTTNEPSTGTQTYTWTNKFGSNTVVNHGNFNASVSTATPTWYALYPGANTVSVVSEKNSVTVGASDTVYANEAPEITAISYTDEEGNTVPLWDGSSLNVPQVSPGQLLQINTTVTDADNTRVNPEDDADGYFSDVSGKFMAKVLDTDGTSFVDESTEAQIEGGDGYTNQGTAAGTLVSSISQFDYEIKPQANAGAGNSQYIVFRVADGFDNVADATAYDVTQDSTALVALPDASGISKAFDVDNTGADFDEVGDLTSTLIGYDPTKTNKAGEFYLESIEDDTADAWKIYDVEAGAYIEDSNGDDITLDDRATADVASNDDTLDNGDALPAPYDWLLIDMDSLDLAAADGDKIYFKTYRTQVVTEVEVIEGPKITSVTKNKYVTLGQQMEIEVYGDNDGDDATVNMVLTSDEGGTLEEGSYNNNDELISENDGDSVTQEVWTYTAPTSWPGTDTVNVNITITDDNDESKKVTRGMTFYLNRNPNLGDINATSNVDTTDGAWVLAGTENISLSASVSDQDSGDKFGYIWNLQDSNSGSLAFQHTSSAVWDPYNGATALTATGGPTLNGHYPIQLTVYDKDTEGVAKTGIVSKTIEIGVNEKPDIGIDSAGVKTDGLTVAPAETAAYDATDGAPWSAAGRVVDDADDEDNDPTTTIDFNQAAGEYPDVKVTAELVGVDDEPDDKNSLKYMYYLSSTNADGDMVPTETMEYYSATDGESGLTNKALRWTPSYDLRKNGGTYYLHARVTDDKNGVAKGINEWSEKIVVTKDTDIQAPAPALASVTVYNTSLADGAAYQAGLRLKAGSKLKFEIPVDGTELPYDANEVNVNIDGVIDGSYDAAGVGDSVMITLTRDEGSDPDDPTDDNFVGEWIAPVDNTVDTAAGGAYGANNDIGLSNFRVTDLVGNTSADEGANDLGTQVAAFNGITLEYDYDPPLITDAAGLTNTTARAENDDATDGSTLNGNTGLDMAQGDIASPVMKIGDMLAVSMPITDNLGDAAGDETYTAAIAYISDIVGEDPLQADGTTYINDDGGSTGADSGVNAWINAEKALSLDTSAASTGVKALVGGGEDLVLNENPTISTWSSANYKIWAKATDNAFDNTAANIWPTTLGNTDYKEIDLVGGNEDDGSNTGIDLKRPSVLSVEIYSYDKTAEDGEEGYAPIGDRSEATDVENFAEIDSTLFGDTEDNAKDFLDDGNSTTAEIVKIKFDEPLLVLEGAGTDDVLISTVNDYSVAVEKFRSDVVNKDNVSLGAKIATTGGGHEVAELEYMKNWAYVATGTTETDTATLYIVIQSEDLGATDVVVANGAGTLTGTGTSFTDDISAGDIVEVFDADTGNITNTYDVVSVDSDTVLTVTDLGGAAPTGVASNAANRVVKSVDRASHGSHFEVIFADYETDSTLAGAQQLRILTDQHGNAINASANNYTEGNNEISW